MLLEISQNLQENTCVRVSFLIKLQAESCNFIKRETCEFVKKETLAQVFSCEFSEISKNTFFTEHILVTTSVTKLIYKETLMVNENLNADLRMKLKDKISDVCV